MLSNIEISEKEEMIIFRFKTHDITAIQSLFVPILRKVDLVPTWDGAMSEALSFSGPYILTSREVDKNTILLSRNPYYTHTNRPFFFDQIRFGFGSTINEIYKTISPDIILANDKTTSKNIQWNPYIPSSLYSVFMNTEKLTPPLRKSIFYDILGTIDTLDESILREENIFLSDISNTPRTATESTFFQTVSAL